MIKILHLPFTINCFQLSTAFAANLLSLLNLLTPFFMSLWHSFLFFLPFCLQLHSYWYFLYPQTSYLLSKKSSLVISSEEFEQHSGWIWSNLTFLLWVPLTLEYLPSPKDWNVMVLVESSSFCKSCIILTLKVGLSPCLKNVLRKCLTCVQPWLSTCCGGKWRGFPLAENSLMLSAKQRWVGRLIRRLSQSNKTWFQITYFWLYHMLESQGPMGP